MPRKGSKLPDVNALSGLAAAWEKCRAIRQAALRNDSVLQWPTPALTGVITFETMTYNSKVLLRLLRLWLPQLDTLKTINVFAARKEVWHYTHCIN